MRPCSAFCSFRPEFVLVSIGTVGISLAFYNRGRRGLFRCHAQTRGINWRSLLPDSNNNGQRCGSLAHARRSHGCTAGVEALGQRVYRRPFADTQSVLGGDLRIRARFSIKSCSVWLICNKTMRMCRCLYQAFIKGWLYLRGFP